MFSKELKKLFLDLSTLISKTKEELSQQVASFNQRINSVEFDVYHFSEVIGQLKGTTCDGFNNNNPSSSGISSDNEIVQNELNEKISMLNLQLENCQKVLCLNNNHLNYQSNSIKTLETTNCCLTSHVSILKADPTGQEQKVCNMESNNAGIAQLEALVEKLVEQGKESNVNISNLANQACKCSRS